MKLLHDIARAAEQMEQLLASAPKHAATSPKATSANGAAAHGGTFKKDVSANGAAAHGGTFKKDVSANVAAAHGGTSTKDVSANVAAVHGGASTSATDSSHLAFQAKLARPALLNVINAIATSAVSKLFQRGNKVGANNAAIDAGMR